MGLHPERDNIPMGLRVVDQWVCWWAKPEGERMTKVPLCPLADGNASSTDPKTWADFESAWNAYQDGTGDGVGFVLAKGDGLVGLDFDHVRDAATGALDPAVARAVEVLATYAEVSPSGTGVRIVGRGELPAWFKNSGTLQAWSWGRFLTITGHRIGDAADIEDFPADKLEAVLRHFCPPKEQPAHDEAPATPRLDIGQAVGRILSGESLHDSLRDLAASLVASRVPRRAVVELLEGAMGQSAARSATPERWEARRAQIPHLVDSALGKFGDDPEQIQWPEVEPLGSGYTEPLPFPVGALPRIVHDAVVQYQAYGQQPMPLVVSSALATMSLVCQGHADIARDDHLTGPLSLFLLPVAKSGERKSAADKAFAKPLRKALAELGAAVQGQIRTATTNHKRWAAQMRGVEKALAGVEEGRVPANFKGKGGQITDDMLEQAREQLTARFAELSEEEPQIPVVLRLFYSDTTLEGLADKMQRGLPVGALWEDEGGVTLGSVGMKEDRLLGFLASFSKLWDGAAWTQDRATVEDRDMDGKRVTVNLMLQPSVLAGLATAAKGVARTQGFLARFLMCEPVSTMGTRLYREPGPMDALQAFTDRAFALYEQPLPYASTENGRPDPHRLDPPTLYLCADAQQLWRAYADEVEVELRERGELVDVGDFASKSAEQAARLAGIFHLFVGYHSAELVSAETMESAITVARWYLVETLRITQIVAAPQPIADARLILQWADGQGLDRVSPGDLGHRGPNPVRDKQRREAALAALVDHGQAVVRKPGNNARVYLLNPNRGRDHVVS
jgi:hypothetical protein